MKKEIGLQEVDEVSVTIIMDNTIDALMPGNEMVRRFSQWGDSPVAADGFSRVVAEHGFSAMIQLRHNGQETKFLLDVGFSPQGFLHNMEALGLEVEEVAGVILSHGHQDHSMGLPVFLEKRKEPVPVFAHPEAFLERKVMVPGGGPEFSVSVPKLTKAQKEKAVFQLSPAPFLLAENMLLVSGEIPRRTSFERGLPIHYTKRGENWEHDPAIMDDQCVVVHVKGKGLVVITGCGHAGIINSIGYAQELTGCRKVHAVLGGFHLTGGIFEPIIPDTVGALQAIQPDYVMPSHCTGWSAIQEIAKAMPKAFIPGNVGTTLVFRA